MKKHIAYYLLAMLGICSCMACTADADEVTTENAQTVSPTSTAARSASVSHDGGHTYTTEELWCQRDGLRIYGVAYVPDVADTPLPLVIYAHGFGGSHSSGTSYAHTLAEHGYMVYCLDFCGATSSSRSDGATTDMSIRTEEADLWVVISQFRADSRVDASRIYLMGASQGGMVSAMTAADHPSEVRAAVLVYPALVIPDDVHEWYPRHEDIPATFNLWGVTLGSIYATDAYDYDIYTELPKFAGDVLIIHGSADNIAPISYSERMVQLYASAELKRIEGAGHGFYGSQQTQAVQWTLDFLNQEEEKVVDEADVQTGEDANIINTDIVEVPAGYSRQAQEQGRVVRLDYQTTSYATGMPMQKYALVYLPYGYDEGAVSRYNVFYLMHGGGGSQASYLGGEGQNSLFKNILDNMIQRGDCQPCIVVAPTFYLAGDGDASVGNSGVAVEQFPKELANDLIPAVETAYRTYAGGSTSRSDLRRSRNHRAFGGFSMGSVCTWWTFCQALDLFRYYVPTSGDCWALGTQAGLSNPSGTAQYLADALHASGYGMRDFYIHVITGSNDIAEPMLTAQTDAMRQLPEFRFGTDKSTNNIYYAVLPGGSHTLSYACQYAYNALLHLWKNETDEDDTTGIKSVTM